MNEPSLRTRFLTQVGARLKYLLTNHPGMETYGEKIVYTIGLLFLFNKKECLVYGKLVIILLFYLNF